MILTVLKSKIAYAKLTATELFYEGSIEIDEDIMDASGIIENEQVHIVNVNNGERLITYVIKGKRGSGTFSLNGPAARKGEVGDEIIILAYAQISKEDSPIIPINMDLKNG